MVSPVVPIEESTLVSFAILNINWEERGRSYIHNFIPFVAECLKLSDIPEVSGVAIQQRLQETFGLSLPLGAIDTILKSAVRDGLLRREKNIFVIIPDAVAGFEISRVRAEVVREHEALVTKFVSFAATRYHLELSREEAEKMLVSYVDLRSLRLAKEMIHGLKHLPSTDQAQETVYVVSCFVLHLFEEDAEGFGHLEKLVKGSMLASAMYFSNPGEITRRFKDLRLFLDTNLLLRALGFLGPTQQQGIHELLHLVRDLGGTLWAFSETVRELQRVLESCANSLRDPRLLKDARSSIVEHCLQSGMRSSDVELAVAKLDRSLESLQIRVDDLPPYSDRTTIDEPRLEKVLTDAGHYTSHGAVVHDVLAVSAVHRLRSGRVFSSIETAQAVFVTAHRSLVYASRQFFLENDNGNNVPHCMLENQLTTIAWLKSPRAAPDLPRKQILSDCYAALNPGDSLWKKYLTEVDRLRGNKTLTDEDYLILRYSVDAQRALMSRTLGVPEAFTTGTVEEVLAEAQTTVKAEVIAELKETAEALETERSTRRNAEENLLRVTTEAEKLRADQRSQLHARARKVAHRTHKVLLLTLAGLILGSVVLSLPPPFPDVLHGSNRIVAGVVAALAALVSILGVFHLSFGVSVAGLVERFERWLELRLTRRYESHFLPDQTTHSPQE